MLRMASTAERNLKSNQQLIHAIFPSIDEWRCFDIIFRAPKKSADGAITPGSFTVLHNGVLVQDHIPVNAKATTAAAFQNFAEKGPIILQDHNNPVRFRNIWLLKL